MQEILEMMLPTSITEGDESIDVVESIAESEVLASEAVPPTLDYSNIMFGILPASQEVMLEAEDITVPKEPTLYFTDGEYMDPESEFELEDEDTAGKTLEDEDTAGKKLEDEDTAGKTYKFDNKEAYRVTRALILSLSLCYHARLEQREEYEDEVVQKFDGVLKLEGGAQQFRDEIRW